MSADNLLDGPYSHNGKKFSDFKFVLSGPGVEEKMLHLQLATLKPQDQVTLMLNFGYAEGRKSAPDSGLAEALEKLQDWALSQRRVFIVDGKETKYQVDYADLFFKLSALSGAGKGSDWEKLRTWLVDIGCGDIHGEEVVAKMDEIKSHTL